VHAEPYGFDLFLTRVGRKSVSGGEFLYRHAIEVEVVKAERQRSIGCTINAGFIIVWCSSPKKILMPRQ
jgi:hypothetical protein